MNKYPSSVIEFHVGEIEMCDRRLVDLAIKGKKIRKDDAELSARVWYEFDDMPNYVDLDLRVRTPSEDIELATIRMSLEELEAIVAVMRNRIESLKVQP